MKVKKKARKEEPHHLSQDFASFDILWFDLVTKTRQLVTELTEPVIDKVHQNKDIISQLIKLSGENHEKIDKLERIVYKKD